MAKAIFAVGCFRQPGMLYRGLGGVPDFALGHAGHVEAVQLDITAATRDRQGPRAGWPYRSAIASHDDAEAARASRGRCQSGRSARLVTRIAVGEAGHRATHDHQHDLERGGGLCH